MSSTRTRAKQLSDDMALIAGIQKYLPNATLTVLSSPQAVAQSVAVIQARVDKAQAVLDARAALQTAILAEEAEDAQSAPYARSLRQSIVAMFANSPSILAEFRLAARKPPTPLTAAKQVLAAAKRAATRAVRHTMGSVQKAALTGNLKDPVVVALDGTASTSNGSSSSATPPPASPPAAPAITNGSTPQS